MDLLKLLDDLFDDRTIDTLAKEKSLEKQKVNEVTQLGLPVLLQKLGVNATSDQERESLAKALDDHGDDDVSDVQGFLNNLDHEDSQKMLGHILGRDKDNVAQGIAKKSGLDTGTVISMLSMLAPLIMGYLGNKKKEEAKSTTSSGGLGDLLGKVTKEYKQSPKTDSSIFDSVGDLLGGDLKDILGGLFK